MDIDSLFNSVQEYNDTHVHQVDEHGIKDTCCKDMNNHVIYNGTMICSCCNIVISNIVDSPEWRYYGSSDTKNSNPTRCGMPVNQLLPKSSVGCIISYKGGKNMGKIRKYQQWNGIPYKERSLLKVFEEINNMGKLSNLPTSIIKDAQGLYKIISNVKISRGANRKGIIAACVYYSCKINDVPRSTNEIADMFSISISTMTKGCKKFNEIAHTNKLNIYNMKKDETTHVDDFIERFCSKLGLHKEDITIILSITNKSRTLNLLNDNTPPSMAAGCIYMYVRQYNKDITKKQLSDTCKISEVTINKCYKKLEPYLDSLLLRDDISEYKKDDTE